LNLKFVCTLQTSVSKYHSEFNCLGSTHTVLVTPNDQYIVAAEDDSINIFPLKPIKESKELQEKLNKLRQSRNQFDKERISSDCHRIISSMNFKKVDIFYEDCRISSISK